MYFCQAPKWLRRALPSAHSERKGKRQPHSWLPSLPGPGFVPQPHILILSQMHPAEDGDSCNAQKLCPAAAHRARQPSVSGDAAALAAGG